MHRQLWCGHPSMREEIMECGPAERARALVGRIVEARTTVEGLRSNVHWNNPSEGAVAHAVDWILNGIVGIPWHYYNAPFHIRLRRAIEDGSLRQKPHGTALTTLYEAYAALFESPEDVHTAAIRHLLPVLLHTSHALSNVGMTTGAQWFAHGGPGAEILSLLLRESRGLPANDMCALLRELRDSRTAGHTWRLVPVEEIVLTLRRTVERHHEPDDLVAEIQGLRDELAATMRDGSDARYLADLDQLLGIPVDQSDGWGVAVRLWFLALPEHERAAWHGLFTHVASGNNARPSTRRLATARTRLAAAGGESAHHTLLTLINHLPASLRMGRLSDRNRPVVRGLLWSAGLYEGHDLAASVADVAVAGYTSTPDEVKLGNAALWALGAMPGMEGVRELQRLAQRLRHAIARRMIAENLTTAAGRLGLTRDDLDELTVSDCDLQDGRIRREIGGYTAEITVVGGTVGTSWFKPDGAALKGPPAAVKREHKDELKALKGAATDLATTLGVQRDRIEGLMLSDRSWSLHDLRERYLDHPLLTLIAGRLVWSVDQDGRAGVWRDGRFVGADDRPLDGLTDETRVRLWHPIRATVDEVLTWRAWLERHGVQQPFKQIYREVYLLTDAERTTRVYSNRFAAHIIRQHQFNALARARGWENRLRLMVDDTAPPATRALPAWNMRAEFWIEGAGDTYGVHTNDTGTYLWLTTDQVRFYRSSAPHHYAHLAGGGYRPAGMAGRPVDALPLDEVPPLVLSEILRDVDLFVGVASIGNDPTWQDGGPDGRYREYWQSYSFGDLSATAHTRRMVLERLLPRLAIAERCTLTDRFLHVRGELRTYKIHLGSGNILMESNDQYLCIVPGRGMQEEASAHAPMLPFEGDRVFSIILSKAFLLAKDTAITDRTITRQIART